jgi:rhodanese-related sulfurtransferase
VAQELMDAGYENARALVGGMDAWIRAGGALEKKTG